jgi:hypothetical protein
MECGRIEEAHEGQRAGELRLLCNGMCGTHERHRTVLFFAAYHIPAVTIRRSLRSIQILSSHL